jgi:O-antigen ligase
MSKHHGLLKNSKHAGTLVLLLTLAIIRPEGFFPGIGIPVGPLCLIIACLFLPLRIHFTLGFSVYWMLYRRELLLIAAYQILCIVSLVYNVDRYADPFVFARWGLVFIAGQMLFPICVFIFLLPASSYRRWSNSLGSAILLLLVLCISLVVVIDVDAPEIAGLLQQFTVAGDIMREDAAAAPTRAVFATRTDLGAIMGIILFLVIWGGYYTKHKSLGINSVFAFLFVLVMYGGLVTGSRNFILFILIAVMSVSAILLKSRPVFSISSFLIACLTLLTLPYFIPNGLAKNLGQFLPYMTVVANGMAPELYDYLPKFPQAALSGRAELWTAALEQIRENPWLGVSNGGYRLSEFQSSHQNTHNIILQALIDGGPLGLAILMALAISTYYRARHNVWALSLYNGIAATLMVDNFTDHSYAWAVVAAFACSLVASQPQTENSVAQLRFSLKDKINILAARKKQP